MLKSGLNDWFMYWSESVGGLQDYVKRYRLFTSRAADAGCSILFFFHQIIFRSLRGDKVSMLTHIYPHKPLRKIEVTICNHQADSPLYVWPNVWSGDLQVQKKYGPTWHRMSLLRPGVIKKKKKKKKKNHISHIL